MKEHITWNPVDQAYTVDLRTVDHQSTSTVVVRSIAALTDCPPDALDSLWKRVHPDALDELIGHTDQTTAGCRVIFQYHGYRVECRGPRELRLVPVSGRGAADER